MPLDPVSALSAAAAAVQFLQFSSQIVSKGKDIYNSAHGATTDNHVTETVTLRLKELTKQLATPSSNSSKPQAPESETVKESEQHIRVICQECTALSKPLLDRLYMLKVPVATEHRKWKSFRQALKTVWSKNDIDKMASRLRCLREELDSHILIIVKETMNNVAFGMDQVMASLDKNTRQVIEDLKKTHAIHNEQLKTHFEHMFRSTRADLVQRDSELRKTRVQIHLLESLRFSEMTRRSEEITSAHTQTFRWLFEPPQTSQKPWDSFYDWLSRGSGIYWVSGKAASGKSTLLRFIWKQQQTWDGLEAWVGRGQIIAGAFYFWNSGTAEQRSHSGLLRSLLYEVLTSNKDLIATVLSTEWSQDCEHATHDLQLPLLSWSLPRLKSAFRTLVGLASEKFRFCFFIDGLDEYDGSANDIAEYVADLSIHFPYAKFCVSSRPWPVFEHVFRESPGLRLQDLTKDDIRAYVEDKLDKNNVLQDLTSTDPEETAALVNEVVEKASGVFLWVELVVKSLIGGLRNGDEISHLRLRLANLPPDLENLYDHMLSRIEPQDKAESSKMFQIFRASGHHLGIDTLYRALLHSNHQDVVDMKIATAQSENDETSRDEQLLHVRTRRMISRLNSRTKGLLEVHYEGELGEATSSSLIQPLSTCIVRATGANSQRHVSVCAPVQHVAPVVDRAATRLTRYAPMVNRVALDSYRGVSPTIREGYGNISGAPDASIQRNRLRCRSILGQNDRPLLPEQAPKDEERNFPSVRSSMQNKKRHVTRPYRLKYRLKDHASWPQQYPYVSYLHRTVRDFLEQDCVWQILLNITEQPKFDPNVALLKAHIIEVKSRHWDLEIFGRPRYEVGVLLFKWLAKLQIPAGSAAANALLEELDRLLSVEDTSTMEHWSIQGPWSNETLEKRGQWNSDVLSMAVFCQVDWYIDAKLKDLASPVFLAKQRDMLLPVASTKSRRGLPLLGYAIGFHTWSMQGTAVQPICAMLSKLLSQGQDPNALFQGYTIWQYAIHYVHIINSLEKKKLDFAAWVMVFEHMLEHGADPSACCIEDNSTFANSLALPAEGDFSYAEPFIATHSRSNIAPHPLSSMKRTNMTIFANETNHQQHHSVEAIIFDVFTVKAIPGVDRLLALLKRKKEAAASLQSQRRKRKKNSKKNHFGNTPRWVS